MGSKNSFFNKPLGGLLGGPGKAVANKAVKHKPEASKHVTNATKGQQAMEKGEKKGEILTGATIEEAGQGRAGIRDRLKEIMEGDSAGAAQMQQDQNQAQKQLRASHAMHGGGGQMGEGQKQSLARAGARDLATLRSSEERQALSDQSKEFRGVVGDIMKSSGQYGNIEVGMIPPAQPKAPKQGVVSSIFGGLF